MGFGGARQGWGQEVVFVARLLECGVRHIGRERIAAQNRIQKRRLLSDVSLCGLYASLCVSMELFLLGRTWRPAIGDKSEFIFQ